MANTMMLADSGSGAILIAGHGHVRGDHGVPVYPRRATPERDLVTITLIGTAGGPTVADQYEGAGIR